MFKINETMNFIIKRLVYAFIVLIVFSWIIFLISWVVPGDPARMALGANVPEWVVERLRKDMHLDEALYKQYYFWIKKVIINRDLGESLTTLRKVNEDIKLFLPASLELALFTGGLGMILASIFGIISGRYQNKWIDNILRVIAYSGVVTPTFVFAIFFILLFCCSFKVLPVMGRLSPGVPPPIPITGLYVIDSLLTRNYITFFDAIKHLILPVASLTMPLFAQVTRIIRSATINNLQSDYISVAEISGIPEKVIIFKYLLKPSLIPGISAAGMSIANLIGNSFIVELTFNWPGMSRYGMEAMLKKDFNAIVGVAIIYALLFILSNIIVDIIVFRLDPRIVIN